MVQVRRCVYVVRVRGYWSVPGDEHGLPGRGPLASGYEYEVGRLVLLTALPAAKQVVEMQGRRCLIASLRGEEETSLLLHLASRVHKYYHEHPAETQCTVFKFQGSGFGLRSSEDRLHTITRQEKYAMRDGLLRLAFRVLRSASDPAARHIGAGAYE